MPRAVLPADIDKYHPARLVCRSIIPRMFATTSTQVMTRSNAIRLRHASSPGSCTVPDRGYTDHAEIPVVNVLIGLAIGMISLIVVFSLVPVLGSSVDNAMPKIADDSPWKDKGTSGHDLWKTVGPLIALAANIAVVAVIMKMLGWI